MFPKKDQPVFDFRQRRDQLGPDHDIYMKRRQIFSIRLGPHITQLRINDIHREDRDENPHTHPFPFLSFILKGRYIECLYNKEGKCLRVHWRSRFSLVYRPRAAIHNIIKIEGPVRTLFLSFVDTRDPKLGQWGFISEGKYVASREYLSRKSESRSKQ